MIWAKNWKNVWPFWNKNSKFQKSVMKIKPEHEQNSKLSSWGWRAWKNWLFVKLNFLALVNFWSMTSLKNDQKMTGDKKVKVTKNQFLYARQPRKGIFEIHSYCGLFFRTVFWNFEFLFQNGRTFFRIIFWLKWLLMVSTLAGWMHSGIQKS